MQEAVDRGPHQSALSDEAIAHFWAEVDEKIDNGQARLILWDSIKDDPPVELKISPIAAIPHKSKQFRSILDLSFHLQLKQGGVLPSVNANTIKTAPKGAIDQLGHTLTRISMHLQKQRTMQRYSWPSGTSRTDFGGCIARRGRNIILPTSYRN